MVRRPLSLLAVAALTSALVAVGAGPSQATPHSWAAWGPVTGTSTAFTTTMTQGSPGFPVAEVLTDSSGPVELAQSAVLGDGTPPGDAYGSSAGNEYLSVGASTGGAPSRTTYTFDRTTPDSGWAFVLGDIDVDSVQVGATDASNAPVPAATIASWFKETFNYAGNAQETPTWDTTTTTLTGNGADTDGASGWFEPTTKLKSLSFTFNQLSGSPSYQAWFASAARPVSGTVALQQVQGADPCAVSGKTVSLHTADGHEVARTTTDPNGAYSFGDVATHDDYAVRLATGSDCRTGQAELAVDNSGPNGAQADFTVEGLVPDTISGRVTGGGAPLAGVELELTRPDGTKDTAMTDGDGRYVFAASSPGTTYQVSVKTPPQGYTAPAPLTDISVAVGQPSTGNDFVLDKLGSVSGTVVDANGSGVPDVPIALGGTGALPAPVVTDADGAFLLEDVPAGTYTVTPTAPEGLQVSGEPSTEIIVGAVGEVVDGLEFVLVPLEAPLPTDPLPTDPPATDPTTPPTTELSGPPATPQPTDVAGDGAGTGTPASRLPNTGGPSHLVALLGGTLLGGGLIVLGGSAVARRRP